MFSQTNLVDDDSEVVSTRDILQVTERLKMISCIRIEVLLDIVRVNTGD